MGFMVIIYFYREAPEGHEEKEEKVEGKKISDVRCRKENPWLLGGHCGA